MWAKKQETWDDTLKVLADLLASLQEQSESDKAVMLAQGFPIFTALLSENKLSTDHSAVHKMAPLTKSYVKECALYVFGIVKQEDVTKMVNETLVAIIKSPVAASAAPEISSLVTAILFGNFKSFPSYVHLFPFLQEFFKTPVFVPEFQKAKGPESCLNLFLDTTKPDLVHLVLKHIEPTLTLYYRDDIELLSNFLELMLQFIKTVTTQVLPYFLTFLVNLLRGRDQRIIDYFIIEKFGVVNEALFAGRAKDMLCVYSDFTEMSKLDCENDESAPLIEKLLDLISMSQSDGEFQLEVLKVLLSFMQELKVEIATSDYFQLRRVIEPTNAENVEVLFKICRCAVESLPQTDKNVILETIRTFVTLKTALEWDISTAFEVIVRAKEEFTNVAISFFPKLIKPATPENLTVLFHKYPVLIELFPIAFGEHSQADLRATLIMLFIGTTLWETDYETFHEVLCVLFKRIPGLFPFILAHVSEMSEGGLRAVLRVVTDLAIHDCETRKFWRENRVFHPMAVLTKSGSVSVEELFDFIASLVFPCINEEIDKDIYELLQEYDFFNASQQQLKRLAFGRLQSDEEGKEKWRLALPSLLPKLDTFLISTPFDQVYCARTAIRQWSRATGRRILDFPSLDRVAKRMLKPSQAQFIIQESKFMLQCIGTDLDCVPVFEFPMRVDNSEITIAYEGAAAVSLWFWVDEPGNEYQRVVKYGNGEIGLKGVNLTINNESVFEFRVSRWNLLVISSDSVIWNMQTHPWKVDGDVTEIVLGMSTANVMDFYIGGCVRLFSSAPVPKTVEKIWRNGAKFVSVISRSEILTLEPTDTTCPKVKHGENARTAGTFPFASYLQTAMGGSKSIFERVLSLVMDDDVERAIDLVHLLVAFQRKELSAWTSHEFAIHMSVLSNYGLIDDAVTQAIMNCLTSSNAMESQFDWEAALTFLLDFRVLESATTVTNMMGFMDCSSIGERHKILLARTAFRAFRGTRNQILNDLFKKLQPPASLVCELLPYLKEHDPDPESWEMLRYCLNSMLKKDFSHWYVLSALSDTEALEVIFVIISLLSGDDWTHVDRKGLMKECVTRCHLTSAWSAAISLMIRVPTFVEARTVIDIDTIDVSLVPDFLIMFGILAGQIHRVDPASRWKRIFDTSLTFLKDIWEYVVVDDSLVFSLMHVLGMGTYTDQACDFPFSTELKEPGDVLEFAMQRSQPFPQSETRETKEQVDDRKLLDKKAVIEQCEKMVPHSFHMIPPFSETMLSYTTSETEYENIISEVEEGAWKNFVDFCREKASHFQFETPETAEETVEKIEKSMITIDILQFVVDFLLDRGDKMVSYLSSMALTAQLYDSHYTVFMLQKVLFFILHNFNTEGIYSAELADFVCERVSEGWFSGQIAPVLALLMGTCSTTISDKMVQTLLLGFDLIPFSQFHIFAELFVSYETIIFTGRDLEFYKILLHNVWKHHDVVPETFSKLLNIIAEQLELLPKEQDVNGVIDCVIAHIRGETYNEEHLEEIKNMCFDAHEEFERESRNQVLGYLNELSKVMKRNEEFFEKEAHSYMNLVVQRHVTMNTARRAVSQFTRCVFDCDIEAFLRIREQTLTKTYRFDHNKGTGRSIVPLCDVFMPSRRIERSPLLYKSKELLRMIVPRVHKLDRLELFPDVQDRVTLNANRIDTVLFSKYQVPKLRFSWELPMPAEMNDQLFEIIVTSGEPIESKHACSFRSFIHQCALPGTLYKLQDVLIFRDRSKNLTKTARHYSMNYIACGYFGKPALYRGIPVLFWKLNDIVKVFKISSNSFEFNMAGGQSFVLDGNLGDFISQLSNTTLPIHSPTLKAMKHDLAACTEKWQKGFIDNYSYLCYLNRLSNRSYCDSTRHAVFPFMFTSFTDFKLRDLSLPMGMIDDEKAKYCKDHYDVSGVHYQKGFLEEQDVFSYMSNIDPFAIFSMQSKPLDLRATLESSDFISEMVPHWFGFTDITEGLVLPKWAANPIHFSHLLLETLQETNSLHLWIDLIFGHKSRGEAAVEAMNVYSQDKLTSEQLFKKPHEARIVSSHSDIFCNSELIVTQEIQPFERMQLLSLLIIEDDIIPIPFRSLHVHSNVFLRIEKNKRRLVCIADDKRNTVFSHEFLRTTNSIHLSSNGMFLVMSQNEGSVCIARVLYNNGIPESLTDLVRLPTNAPVLATAVSSADFLAVAICGNRLRRFCLARLREIESIDAKEKINTVAIDERNGVIVIGCEKSFVIYTVGGKLVWAQQCGSPVSAVACCNVRRTLCIVTGHKDGYVFLWYYNTKVSMVVNCFAKKVAKSEVTVIAQNATTERLVVGNNTQLTCLDFKGTTQPPLHKKFVINCPKCGTVIAKRKICSECKRQFCNKCVKSIGKKMPHLKRHICEFCAKKSSAK